MYRIVLILLPLIFSPSMHAQTDSISDIEGKQYKVVKIGDQWWMAENLAVGKFRNGDSIPFIKDNTEWETTSSAAYCYMGNKVQFQETYGNLYNWQTVNDERGLCPEGWHVSSDEDWMEMEKYLGMSQTEAERMTAWRGTNEGTKLKATTFEGTDEVGFGAVGTGYRAPDGQFLAMGTDNDYWTSTSYNNDGATEGILHGLLNSKTTVVRNYHVTNYGFCVRCVKDAVTHSNRIINNAKIKLYPNPSADFLNISSGEGKDMSIQNLNGQILYEAYLASSKESLDLNFLFPGTYVIRLRDKRSIESYKFIKQ